MTSHTASAVKEMWVSVAGAGPSLTQRRATQTSLPGAAFPSTLSAPTNAVETTENARTGVPEDRMDRTHADGPGQQLTLTEANQVMRPAGVT